MLNKFHLLFICSSNITRSPLAASLFEGSPDYEAISAGINPSRYINGKKTIELDQKLIDWADKIFVMDEKDEKQATYLHSHFRIEGKNLEVLDIPDKYNISLAKDYQALKEELEEKLSGYLNK